MSWAKEIASLRKWVIEELDTRINRLFGYTATGQTSAMGSEDAVQKSDNADDGQRPVQRIEPWGLRSRPPGKVRGLWLRLGSSNVAFIGIMPTKAYGPNDAEEGETILYNTTAAMIKLLKAGKITVDSDTGESQDVVVNGGSKKVARVDDTTTNGTIEILGGIGSSFAGIKYTPPSGPAVTINATGIQATISGEINSGADNFKA